MRIPNPLTFLEVVGTGALALGFVFAFLAIRPSIRDLGFRLTGLGFIVGLALFANHWAVYFAAVFIAATSVTTSEFLRDLAAIIRGSKEYFEWKKSAQQPASMAASTSPSGTARSAVPEPAGRNSGAAAVTAETVESFVSPLPSASAGPLQEAIEALIAGRFEEASAKAAIVLEVEPDNAQAMAIRAEAFRSLGQLANAIGDASRAIELDPNNTLALRTRAEAYRGVYQFDNAVRDATRAVELNPSDAFALRARGDAYRMLGQFDNAIRDATKVIELAPGDSFALRTRAEAYRGLRQFDNAVRDASRVIESNPEDQGALRTRAEAYNGLGQFDNAIRDASRALEQKPNDAYALRTRAEAYRCLGQPELAIRDASRSLQIEPSNAIALRTIELAGKLPA